MGRIPGSDQEDCEVEDNLAQIHQSMQTMIGLHRQLLELVRQEREALTQADLQGVQQATYAKEALIEQIRAEESRRAKPLAGLALALRKPVADLSLNQLIILVQGTQSRQAEALRVAYQALQVLTGRIIEQNDYNRGLIERSLEHVQQMKHNVLGESVPASNSYGSHGQRVNRATSGARLLSQEA